MQLGEPDVEALADRLPARQLLMWQAYAQIEPWRLEDESARVYPPPKPEQVRHQMAAFLDHYKRSKDGV